MKEEVTVKRTKKVQDYVDEIQKKFPEVPKKDIEKILTYGFRLVYLHEAYGGDILIKGGSIVPNFFFLIGRLTYSNIKHFKYYVKKMIIRIRVIFNKAKPIYNGYYYFALSEKEYQDKIMNKQSPLGKKKKKFEYGPTMLYKIEKECLVKEYNRPYIYRIPIITDLGFKVFKRSLITTEAEFLYKRETKGFKNVGINNYTEFKEEILKNNKCLRK